MSADAGVGEREEQRLGKSATPGKRTSVTVIVAGAIGVMASLVLTAMYAVKVINENAAGGDEPGAVASADAREVASSMPEVAEVDAAEVVLTEAGVAASGYPSALAVWREAHDPRGVFDGIYEGGQAETPCFTFDVDTWWVVGGDESACQVDVELWWEEYSGVAPREIKLFGSGAAGAAVRSDALPAELLDELGVSHDQRSIVAFLTSSYLPSAGVTELTTVDLTLDSTPAVVIHGQREGMSTFSVYVAQAPTAYPTGSDAEAQWFLFYVYNELEWVQPTDEIVNGFESSFRWK